MTLPVINAEGSARRELLQLMVNDIAPEGQTNSVAIVMKGSRLVDWCTERWARETIR
jgi:hypothetical protein